MKKTGRRISFRSVFCAIFVLFFFHSGIPAQDSSVEPMPKLTINMDINDDDGVLYQEHSIQTFLEITNNTDDVISLQVEWRIETDDWRPLMQVMIPSKVESNKKIRRYCPWFEFPGPGFYRISGTITSQSGETYRAAKVIGIDPEKISVSLNRQIDFDKFWEVSLKELAAIPPDYKVTPQKREGNTQTELYKVEMTSFGGLTVRGWLEVPKKKGKYPALLRVPGYQEHLKPIDKYDDLIVFSFNTRDHGESDDTGKRGYDMWVRGFDDKDNYFYRGLYLDCIRAVDFLMSRKDVDPDRIAIWGGSQGGGLSFATAMLDQRIDLCIADIPFLCDLSRYLAITHWDEVDIWFEEHPEQTWQSILRTLSYFDTKNMANKIKCPVIMSVGLQDDVCPPSTSFATYNLITSPKEYTVYKHSEHWLPERHWEDRFSKLRKIFEMD